MTRLIALGILSALFFSSTFVLNRAMGLQGGHWVWTASLRYGYMLILLCLWLLLTRQGEVLRGVFREYCRHWLFWTAAGSIGFGLFYALLSFSASFAPGWVVATTWQTTILATPAVLLLFGRRVPAKGLAFSILIFAGIMLVTIEQAGGAPLRQILLGTLPVLGAAFAYPLGNQLVWEARYGTMAGLPRIAGAASDNSVGRVLLLVLGSVPFWLALLLVTRPSPPSAGQLLNSAIVAVFSGVIATSLFLHARHQATSAYQLAAVDATQSTEVLFSLLGEIVFLQGALPGLAGGAGIALTVIGLILYVRLQATDGKC
ncbi:MAG TPA: multidrug resistance efflux transporter family protein [Geobacteraceae bacterium]